MHCVGMCGPLTCFVFKHKNRNWAIFQYQASRLFSYTVISLSISLLGNFTTQNLNWIRLSKFLLASVIALVLFQLSQRYMGKKIQSKLVKMSSSTLFPSIMGLMTGLFPCGLLIPAYIGAASYESKTFVIGAIALFFMGTLPALLTSQSLIHQIKRRLPSNIQPWFQTGLGVVFLLVQAWWISQ